MRDVGGFLGILIIFSYGLTLLNFLLKWAYKNIKTQINKVPVLKTEYTRVMRFFIKYHRYFGFTTIVFILMHFSVQFSRYGASLTGATAAILMLTQVVVGIIGLKSSKKSKAWLWVHRALAIGIGIAILIHVN